MLPKKTEQNSVELMTLSTIWTKMATTSDPIEIVKFESGLTIAQCLKSTPIKFISEDVIPKIDRIKAVRQIILNTARSFKFAENMDLSQATTLASDVLEQFNYETLEDIAQMFKMARQGLLGSSKGRLDSDSVFNIFIPAYLNIKAEEREKIHQREKAERLKAERLGSPDDRFNQLANKILQQGKERKSEKELPNELTSHEKFIENLKLIVEYMTESEIKEQIKQAKTLNNPDLDEAIEIYQSELDKRIS